MDKCLKDKAHFIIAQTIWNNKNGKAVFAEQVFDRCQKKFQDEINKELYKLIEQGGGGGTGKDGKTPVLKAGNVTSLPYGTEPTFKLVYEGDNTEGNPVYRMDLGLPQGKPGEDGDDGDDGISPTLRLTEQGIEVSYDKGSTYNLLVPISEFHVTNNITNEYINNPDEEDITVVDDKLKFKDKEYNLSEFSGLGRVYLRKNIVNGKNILAYNAFNSSSAIYHIQYDYDLNGRTVVVPNNCVLLFEGGSLSNGTIVGNDTVINAQLIKIFNEDISLDGTWKINGIYPEWYGATPYKKDVIYNSTAFITLKENLIDSNDAFDKVKEVLVNTNIHTIILSALYYVTKEIDINVVAHYTNGTNIIGNGTDTGLIASINNTSASVLSINKNNNTISQYDYLSNFAIYITKNSQLDSAILLYEIIRSTCVDVKVYGGFAKFEKGIYHLHSVVNNNIFLNVFERCVGVNSTKGGGIHYSHKTYQPTLQSIQNCIFQQLAGAAIEAEPTPITGGGFGGIIQGNELEGNIKGAIALSGIHNLSVRNNYFECADYNQLINYFDNVPPAVFTFGIIQGATGANYITNVSNLEISNNQIGAPAGSIDYAIIICSTQSGGRSRNVNISNNIINTSTAKNVGPKYITKVQHCSGININDNLFSINYDDVNANFPIDLNDISSNGINYSYQSIKTSFSSAYKYGYQTNIGILRTNGFNTETNYPYLTPNKSGITVTLSAGDFILLESNNTIYKVLKGGRLHYHTSAKFTQGSNVVVCSISIWDWKVGDIVNSDYINNGTATITAIDGNKFTLSENATVTIDDWLTDAIVLPYELSSAIRTSGTTSQRPNYRYTKIPNGFKYFDTSLGKPTWWNGSTWITYPESGGGGGADGKTPVMQIGNVTTVDAGEAATANVRQDGTDVNGNPIYKIDFGISRGANGANGDDGIDGKTPVFEAGIISTLEPNQAGTCTITKTGDDPQGNPIYRVDVGIPKGDTGAPGSTPSLKGYATEEWVTTKITNTIGIINASLNNINGEIV